MAIVSKELKPGIEIDLTGPQGNAYVLLATARDLARRLGYSREEINDLIKEMKGSDYEYLVQTFDDHFGLHVTLYR
jgi:hypothetical protein